MVLLVVPFWNRTGNDQWSTGIIDQYAIHLIHHRIVVLALYHLFRGMHHVVAQIVKTKFVIGAICDISQISLAAGFGVRPRFVQTIRCPTPTLQKWTTPLRPTTIHLVVRRYHRHAFSCPPRHL